MTDEKILDDEILDDEELDGVAGGNTNENRMDRELLKQMGCFTTTNQNLSVQIFKHRLPVSEVNLVATFT